MTIGIKLHNLEAHHSKERTRLSGNAMERPVLSLHGFVEYLDEISLDFELSLFEEDYCVGIGETNAEVHCHQEDERVCFTFEFNKVDDHGNKRRVLKISFNEIDMMKPVQRRFSTARRNEDLGSPNLSSLDGSTKRFLIKVSYLARILIFLIGFQSTFAGSKAESSEYVQNVMTAIGGSIRLDCRTSDSIEWTHLQIDQPTPDDIHIDGRGLIGAYKKDGRHSLKNGTKNLLITNITTKDAGTYRCTIKRTSNDIVVFYLAVAVSKLECSMNPNWNDIVGENDCGIEPDNITFSCSIKYHGSGNFVPTLQWRNSGQPNIIENGVKTSLAHGYFMSMLSVTARLALNETYYVCRVNESQLDDNQLTWQFPPLNIRNFFSSPQITEVSGGDEIRCMANFNQSCDYQWINNKHKTVINSSILNLRDDSIQRGFYYCRVVCRIRTKTCVALSLVTEIPIVKTSNIHVWIVVVYTVLLFCFIIIIMIGMDIRHRRRHHFSLLRRLNIEPEWNTHDVPMFIRGVSRTEDVTGLVVFEKRIYVICSESNRILTFSKDGSLDEPDGQIPIDNMKYPWDITCSEANRFLYISDKSHECVWNIKMPDKNISNIKMTDENISKLKIDGQPRGMSITQENELLVVCRDESEQYSLDIINSEDKRQTIHLPTEMSEVWQAICLFSKNFIISHQENGEHRISEVSSDGKKILRRFNLESSSRGSLHSSFHQIARDNLFIIDPSAERVYSLNTKRSQEREIRLMISQYHLRLMMRLFLIEKMKKRMGGHWLKLSSLASDQSKQG